MCQAHLAVERPVQVVLEQIKGLVVLVLQYRLGHQPVQLGAVAHQAVAQRTLVGCRCLDFRQGRVIGRVDRFQRAIGPLQIGWQQAIKVADHDQRHVVGGVPGVAHLLELFASQVIDLRTLRAFKAQLHRQLVTRGVAQILAIEPALQVRVVATVLTLHHLLGRIDCIVVKTGLGQQGQQQIQHFALVFRRRFDDECGVGVAGVGIPLAAQGLHALFQPTFAGGVDAAEQQMFEQVRQLLVGATEVIQTDAHHQANRHMTTVHAGLEQQLQTVGQRVALDLEAIQGE